ncbi:hypothetical protein OAV88_03830, partial [bacterium]|nr:hypothetical protein [bacterium]
MVDSSSSCEDEVDSSSSCEDVVVVASFEDVVVAASSEDVVVVASFEDGVVVASFEDVVVVASFENEIEDHSDMTLVACYFLILLVVRFQLHHCSTRCPVYVLLVFIVVVVLILSSTKFYTETQRSLYKTHLEHIDTHKHI